LKKINKIIIHCSATREGEDISASTIDKWHKKRGWKGIGYHFVVRLNGIIETGRMLNECGAHTKGENCTSIGVCYIGGVENFKTDGEYKAKDTRTQSQKESLIIILRYLKKIYPEATIHGHREFAKKACPSFNAFEEYKDLTKTKTNGIYTNKLARIIDWLYGFLKSYNQSNANRK